MYYNDHADLSKYVLECIIKFSSENAKEVYLIGDEVKTPVGSGAFYTPTTSGSREFKQRKSLSRLEDREKGPQSDGHRLQKQILSDDKHI